MNEPTTKVEHFAWQIARRWGRNRGAMPQLDNFFADLNWRQFMAHAEALQDAIVDLSYYLPARERDWFNRALGAWAKRDIIPPWACRQMVEGDL